ncbi:hypothetical protein MPER_02633 [Moniliophthora perniciosa FA553]|nr:hypothetical protein MPER_02633 [Moniliophthora perniciosa FA553]
MNDVSRAIVAVIEEYNRVALETTGHLKAAYTYDAGPNAVIYAPKENLKEIIQLIINYFPQDKAFKDNFSLFAGAEPTGAVPQGFNEGATRVWEKGSVKGLIHTKARLLHSPVDDGPRTHPESEVLLGSDGLPNEKCFGRWDL